MPEQLVREDSGEHGDDERGRSSDGQKHAAGEKPRTLDDIIESYAE